MKFLIICREAPTQLISARMFKLAKYLRTFHEVTLICQKSESILPLTHAGIKVHIEQSNFEKLADLAKKEYDVVIFANWFLARIYYAFVKRQFVNAKTIIDASDLQFIRDEKMFLLNSQYITHTISSGEIIRNRDDELEMYALADVCWASSEEEKNILLKLAPQLRIEVIPTICANTIDHSLVKTCHSAYFIGTSYRQSDIDANGWFMNEIFDGIRKEIKDFSISLIGNYDDYFIEQNTREGVNFKTFRSIEYDIDFSLRQHAICVLPVRFYSGVDERLVQAIMNDIPVVTTSVIADPLKLIQGDVIIANTAQEFINGTTFLLNDMVCLCQNPIEAKRKLLQIADLEKINERIFKHL